MLFNSVEFIFGFLPLFLLLLHAVRASRFSRYQSHLILLASLLFYSWSAGRYLLLLIGSTAFNFAAGEVLRRHPRRPLLAAAIAADLLVLAFYKYFAFGVRTLDHLLGFHLAAPALALPIGISFYTFTQIAYLVDVYRGRVTDGDPVRYGLFVTYFPHLIAGPLLHHEEMTRQFREQRTGLRALNLAAGLTIFTIGLCKKVVLADSYIPYVAAPFSQAAAGAPPGMLQAWMGALSYALQIYFDFSGYTDMAIGLAVMMGFRLPQNFNSPYKAISISDFWQRWHMTLSRFLRDYLYIPLGGNRRGDIRSHVNVMITMLLGGLWHGAGWLFVLWGAMHGVYIVIERIWKRWAAPRDIALPAFVGGCLTFLGVVLAWVPFRAGSVPAMLNLYRAMMSGTIERPSLEGVALVAGGLLLVWLAPNTQQLLSSYRPVLDRVAPAPVLWTLAPRHAGIFALLIVITVIFANHVSEFIYFRF